MIRAFKTRSEAVWVALGSLAFALFFFHQIVARLHQGDRPTFMFNDWDLNLQFHGAAVYTITHFHQFPFWNPYKSGGEPLFGHPQSAILTPFLLLDLLFGPVVGLRLGGIAHVAIGFAGAYFLARVVGISKLGAVVCATAFAGSSWPYMRFEVGESNFMAFAYAPWAIALWWFGVERRRLLFAAVGGLLLGLMLMEGALYQLLFAGTMLAVLAPILASQRRSLFPLLLLAVMGAFTVGFCAIKLLPGVEWTGLQSTIWGSDEFVSARALVIALFSRDQTPLSSMYNAPGVTWPFFEYGNYVGVWVAGLALIGIGLQFRKAFPWSVLAMALLVLAAGNFGPYSPWALTHRLPFFASMRVPSRWLISFTLVTAVLAGFGLDAIRETSKRWGMIVTVLLTGIVLIDNWLVSAPYLHYVVDGTPPELSFPRSVSFRQAYLDGSPGWNSFGVTQANMGLLGDWDRVGLIPPTAVNVRAYNRPGYKGEQYLLGTGTVELRDWTPNALSFDADAPSPTLLVVNQNYDPSWRVVEGPGVATSNDGLIGVRVAAGKQHLLLAYHSTPFLIGLGITLTTFAGMLLLWLFEGWRTS